MRHDPRDRSTPPTTRSAQRAGFSLTELLVVVFIIAVIIALAVPALNGARNAASRLATTNLLNQITTASQSFRADNAGRMPGLFDIRDLGSNENADAGLTAMENILLDLSGSEAVVGFDQIPAGQEARFARVHWNPGAPNEEIVFVDPNLLGAGADDYFAPPADLLQAQFGQRQFGALQNTGPEGALQMPDLVDPFGQPILAWVADVVTTPVISDVSLFARRSSTDGPARYYWNSNAGYLRANRFGDASFSPTTPPDQQAFQTNNTASLIGQGAIDVAGSDEAVANLMAAFYGSPAYPADGTLGGGSAYDAPFPTQGRGELILQSAGLDGVPFSSQDDAVRRFATPQVVGAGGFDLRYGINFALPGNARRTDDDGQNTTIDFADAFDDIIVSTE